MHTIMNLSSLNLISPLTFTIGKLQEKKESYQNQPGIEPATPTPTPQNTGSVNIVSLVINIIVFMVAFFISWQCNSKMGTSVPMKIIYAIFAGIFGIIYIIFHLVLVGGNCCKCEDNILFPKRTNF